MTKFIKVFFIFSLFLLGSNYVLANINNIIENNYLFKTSTVAVSVKDVNTEASLYKYNCEKLLHPASTLKLLTMAPVIDTLGDNYIFKTEVFIDNNNWYIKLSGDPLLTSDNLNSIIKQTKKFANGKNPNKIYIDTSNALDEKTSGTGWMNDDNINWFMPTFSSYNLDGNCVKVNIIIDEISKQPKITCNDVYNINFINNLTSDLKDDFNYYRSNLYSDDFIIFEGSIKNPKSITVPVLNPKRHFIAKLDNILKKNNISYYNNYEIKKTPNNAKLAACYETPAEKLYPMVLKNSNNMLSETLFKIAGKEKLKTKKGSFEDGKIAFYDFYINKLNLNPNYRQIKLEDASGLSRNNLVTVDFMTDAIIKLEKYKNLNYRNYLTRGNQGTLTNRFIDIRDNIWAKTGTLDGISTLAGYILDENNNLIAFTIMIQNYTENNKDAKKLEDEIVYAIYRGEIN